MSMDVTVWKASPIDATFARECLDDLDDFRMCMDMIGKMLKRLSESKD